jgi:hypothetical protein
LCCERQWHVCTIWTVERGYRATRAVLSSSAWHLCRDVAASGAVVLWSARASWFGDSRHSAVAAFSAWRALIGAIQSSGIAEGPNRAWMELQRALWAVEAGRTDVPGHVIRRVWSDSTRIAVVARRAICQIEPHAFIGASLSSGARCAVGDCWEAC